MCGNMKFPLLYYFLTLTAGLPGKRPNFKRGKFYIIGGTDATYGEFPYQVSLQDGSFGFDYHICGGSIYNENYVVTAAHCLTEKDISNPSYLKVYGGEQNLYSNDGFEQIISVQNIIIHEDYDAFTLSHDIALLNMMTPFDFSGQYVGPIALPLEKQDSEGICTMTGWGDTSPNGDPPTVLQKVSIPVISDADCRAIYGQSDIEDSMLCAGSTGKGGCSGDSGGPLACVDSVDVTYLAGIGSWGYGCTSEDYPAVFTEVSYYVDWLEHNAQ